MKRVVGKAVLVRQPVAVGVDGETARHLVHRVPRQIVGIRATLR